MTDKTITAEEALRLFQEADAETRAKVIAYLHDHSAGALEPLSGFPPLHLDTTA